MQKIKNELKKVPGLKWIANTNKKIFDLQQSNEKLLKKVNDLEEQLNKTSGKVLLSNNEIVIDKIAVYTVITDSYDSLYNPIKIESKYCDYYCFTDNINLKSDVWNIIYVDKNDYKELKDCDSVKFARYIKTHPHMFLKDYKYSIFIDANLQITKSLVGWVCLYRNDADLLTFKHPDRNCIYDEAKKCIEMKKDDEKIINAQMMKYQNDGYPTQNGLVMTNMIFRKHTKEINDFNELWWNEIKNGSRRDQLSFNYVLSKNNISIDLCPLHAAFNDYFEYHYHDKRE